MKLVFSFKDVHAVLLKARSRRGCQHAQAISQAAAVLCFYYRVSTASCATRTAATVRGQTRGVTIPVTPAARPVWQATNL